MQKIKQSSPQFKTPTTSTSQHASKKHNLISLIQCCDLSLFERTCHQFPEFLSLLTLDLKTYLILKQVSKNLYSVIGNCPHINLSNKLNFSFQYSQFGPFTHTSKKNKLEFVNKNAIPINLIVSVDDLLNLIKTSNITPKKTLKITLKINLKDPIFNDFIKLSQLGNSLTTIGGKFASKISEINFGDFSVQNNLDVAPEISKFLTTISENIQLFPNLRSMIIGNINCSTNINLVLPTTIQIIKIGNIRYNSNATFELSGLLENLSTIIIGNITSNKTKYNTHFILNKSALNLSTLIIGNIKVSSFSIPEYLDNIETLALGDTECISELKLPKQLNNLINLTLGVNDPILKLPMRLPNLKNLIIKDISTCILPENIDSLEYFNLNTYEWRKNENF